MAVFGCEIRAQSACYPLSQELRSRQRDPFQSITPDPMTLSSLALLIAVLLVPLVLLWRLTETRPQTINRLRRNGQSWQSIADRYGVSRRTVARERAPTASSLSMGFSSPRGSVL